MFPPELAKLAPKGGDTSFLLSPGATDKIPAAILTGIKEALATSIASTFFWALIPAVLSIICILLMGNERLLQDQKRNKTEAGKLIYRKETAYPFMKTDMPFIICIKFLYIGVETA